MMIFILRNVFTKFLQQIESEQNLLLEIQSFNNTEALLDVVKTDSEIKLTFFGYYFYRKQS